MADGSVAAKTGALRPGRVRAACETLVIASIFAAAGAWPVPDINETVYLTKARHAADPTWAAGDFFLETPDAHGIFYLLFGPLAAVLPLEQAAWVGRWLGWLALAVGFRHAAVPLFRTAFGRLAAAALFSLAVRCTPMAGEWVIGGCEAKVFAWAAVFGGLGELARGRLPAAWLITGVATAFHPLVGGWGLVALAVVWVAGAFRGTLPSSDRRVATACLVGGLAAAAAGVLPALGLAAGADAATRAAAVRIYVVERLPHHLLPTTFAEPLIARHLLALIAAWLLARMAPLEPARARVHAFTLVTLAVSVVGWCLALAEPLAPETVLGLLRYYWFRLADGMAAFSLAIAAAAVLEDDAACRRLLPASPRVLRAAVLLAIGIDLAVQSRHWPLPGRAGIVSRADLKIDAVAWAEACDWIRTHTPTDARFLTPRGAASFTWRTGRPEVVSWKNSPQDPRSLVEWRRRILDCFSRSGRLSDMERSTAALGAQRMREVADRYGADHAVVPADLPGLDRLPFERLHANAGFVVYRLRPEAGASRPAATP